MTKKPRLAFAANRNIGLKGVELILEADWKPAVLLVPKGRNAEYVEEMKQMLRGVPILQGKEFRESKGVQELKSLNIDYLLSVHFPYVIPKEVFTIPRLGSLNLHPALLPFNRGWHTPTWAIIEGTPSDVVLLNPSLTVIIDGVREGRRIFANSMKYLRVTLASNFGNFYALALSSLFIPYLPMLPIQVLLLNLLSDFPMMSIATDNVDDKELERPRGYKIAELVSIAVVLGIVSTIFDFAFFGYFQQFGESVLQTMWFVGSIFTELFAIYSMRTMLPFWRARRPAALSPFSRSS